VAATSSNQTHLFAPVPSTTAVVTNPNNNSANNGSEGIPGAGGNSGIPGAGGGGTSRFQNPGNPGTVTLNANGRPTTSPF